MSNTRFSIACETNQAVGFAQENVYFQGVYRKPEDFAKPFNRSAKSNSTLQVLAVFSADGPDNITASALQTILQSFGEMVDRARAKPDPDMKAFSSQLVYELNDVVCQISASAPKIPLRVSFTAAVIFDDVLRVIGVGNTKAFLVRNRKLLHLSENKEDLNRRIHLNEIDANTKRIKSDRSDKLWYLGTPANEIEGLLLSETSFQLKPNDEIFLMGVGVLKYVPKNIISFIVVKEALPKTKTNELIKAAYANGAKGGLTAIAIRTDSISKSMVPAAYPPMRIRHDSNLNEEAFSTNNDRSGSEIAKKEMSGTVGGTESDSNKQISNGSKNVDGEENKPLKTNSKWKKRLITILTPIILFLVFALVGYFTISAVLKSRKIDVGPGPEEQETVDEEQILNKVMYSLSDQAPVYAEESIESDVVQFLFRGEPVTIISQGNSFSKIQTESGEAGFVISIMLSETDPTIGETIAEMSADPTPIPEFATPTPSPTSAPTTSTTSPETTGETATETTGETTTETTGETTAETTGETTTETTGETTTETTGETTAETTGETTTESTTETTAETTGETT